MREKMVIRMVVLALALLLSLGGLAMIAIYGNWQIMAGVLLFAWGHSLSKAGQK